MTRAAALEALVAPARALLDDVTSQARNSFTEYRDGRPIFTDAIWKATDPAGFRRVAALRKALARLEEHHA